MYPIPSQTKGGFPLLILLSVAKDWIAKDMFYFFLKLGPWHSYFMHLAARTCSRSYIWIWQWYLELRVNPVGVCSGEIPLPAIRQWRRVDEFLWASANHCGPATSVCSGGSIFSRILLFHFSLVSTACFYCIYHKVVAHWMEFEFGILTQPM